jgi:hypothetical protein
MSLPKAHRYSAQLEALSPLSNRRCESDSPQNHYNVPEESAASSRATRAMHRSFAGCQNSAVGKV